MAFLTDKQKAMVRAVFITGMTTHRASLARVIGVYLNSHRRVHERLISDHALQLCQTLKIDETTKNPCAQAPQKVGPLLKSPSFTHILQMDFVKRSEARIVVADCFIASTVLLRSTGDLPKMWGRIRLKSSGILG